MPVQEIYLDLPTDPLPDQIRNFLEAADKRCDEVFDTGKNKTMPSFIPADYELVYRAIKELNEKHTLLGNRFCEWGSGIGTATCTAALLGFEAHGVEIEPELVKRSRELASQHQIEANFIESSFLPEGFDFLRTQGGRELLSPHNAKNGGHAYEEVDWELEDIDLFYVYPWPHEQESNLELFEILATEGAYMVCYYGDGELCVYQKT